MTKGKPGAKRERLHATLLTLLHARLRSRRAAIAERVKADMHGRDPEVVMADIDAFTAGSDHPDARRAQDALREAREAATPIKRRHHIERAWYCVQDFEHAQHIERAQEFARTQLASKAGMEGKITKQADAAAWQTKIKHRVAELLDSHTDVNIARLLAPDTKIYGQDGTLIQRARGESAVAKFVAEVRAEAGRK